MTHFWPDYTALIAELRADHRSEALPKRLLICLDTMRRAADALEAERRVRMEEYAIAKHLRMEQRAALAELVAEAVAVAREECIAIAQKLYVSGVTYQTYPTATRHADALDVLMALRALAHPTAEPDKAEEP